MSDDEAREEKELDLTSPDVVTKYKSAAEIVNSSVSDLIYDILRCEILHETTFNFCTVQRRFSWWHPSASPKPRLLIFASKATLLSGSTFSCSFLCFLSYRTSTFSTFDLCTSAQVEVCIGCNRQAGNIYKNVKRKIERGVAFPTCISVNNTVCHFSPLASDDAVLEENDIVKMYVLARLDC